LSLRVIAKPRFANTSCSQCGGEFGPGDHGYSHCENHAGRSTRPMHGTVDADLWDAKQHRARLAAHGGESELRQALRGLLKHTERCFALTKSEEQAKVSAMDAAREALAQDAMCSMTDKHWTVFNGAGAVIAENCTLADAADELPDDAFERCWTVVYRVVVKNAEELRKARSSEPPK
jgi:hypothetical protein